MIVFFFCNVLSAVITNRPATGTHNLVAATVLVDGGFTFWTRPKDSLGAGFLDLMSLTHPVLFLEFLAAEGNMGDVSAFAAANFLAPRIAAAKFFVDFDGWTDGSEVAERAAFKVCQIGFTELRLLLKAFELLYSFLVEEACSFLTAERLLAATAIHAGQSIAGISDLRVRVCSGAFEAKGVRLISAAKSDLINRNVITETTSTFHDLAAVSEAFLF